MALDLDELKRTMQTTWTKRRAAMTPEARAEEDARYERLEAERLAAMRPEADDHLAIIRVSLPRWSVVQWWLMASVRDWRTLVANYAACGTMPLEIRAAVDRGRARTIARGPWTQGVLAVHVREVFVRFRRRMTVAAAMAELRGPMDHQFRGNPRIIGYEYTGRRALREGDG